MRSACKKASFACRFDVILTSGSHAWLFACQWIFQCDVWHAMFWSFETADDPDDNGGDDSGVTDCT